MTDKFNLEPGLGATGEEKRLYPEPRSDINGKVLVAGTVRKIPSENETEDWIKVRHTFHPFPAEEGWVRSWVIGKPVQSTPQMINFHSTTFSVARNEVAAQIAKSENIVSSEFVLGVMCIENHIATLPDPLNELSEVEVNPNRANQDAIGAFGITTEEWDLFIQVQGKEYPGWDNPSVRYLTLPQMRCFYFLTQRYWRDFNTASNISPTNPKIPRKLDLFISRLIGVKAAVEVARRERENEELNKKINTLYREANSLPASSVQEKKLLEYRADFLLENGNPVTIAKFLEIARAKLNEGLQMGYDLLDTFIPEFLHGDIVDADWMPVAEKELKVWQTGGWTEKKDPGQKRALGYFSTVDDNPSVSIAADGEITHWCGAFVAFCMHGAGQEIPTFYARSASWVNWGDISLPTKPGSQIPKGAVVMMASSENTDQIGHVAFFVKWDGDNNERVLLLGGNQSDKVSIASVKSENIVAIRHLEKEETKLAHDTLILAKTLYGEIRGGRDIEIENVAHVIFNRAETGYRSGGTIAGACLSPMQFSCWNPGTSARAQLDALSDDLSVNSGNAVYENLKRMAKELIDGRKSGARPDTTKGARHYHTIAMSPYPNWANSNKVVNVDDNLHIFYVGIA